MSEYIKKDSVIKSITSQIISSRDATIISEMMLADVPEEDVIDVVRCKDCVKRHDGCPMQVWCGTDDNDYCSRGERE